jgi:uncharacterized protein with HEPN domain
MKKDPLVFITHIIECIELIEKYIKGKTKKEFLQDIQLQDSVIRRIEIIGETTKNIPKALKDKYPDIPWKRIAGMRDILVHDYLGIDLNLTWGVAKKEIPKLKNNILKIKKDIWENNKKDKLIRP